MKYGKELSKVSDGYLTLKHYKEPMRAIPKKEGFGYYGAVMGSLDGQYLQCHICGNLYGELTAHFRFAHKITNKEYKERFMLSGKTALISEQVREVRKQRTLAWLKSMTPQEKQAFKEKSRRRFKAWAKKNSLSKLNRHPHKLETKNKRGTCPDQLLDKIRKVSEIIGHTPSLREFILETGGQRYKHLIFATFGSWKKALAMLDMQPAKPKGGREIGGGYIHYSNEELLEYLRIFTQENRTVPTTTDGKRGWIPGDDTYRRRFGSIERARQLAGVYDILDTKVRPGRWAKKAA